MATAALLHPSHLLTLSSQLKTTKTYPNLYFFHPRSLPIRTTSPFLHLKNGKLPLRPHSASPIFHSTTATVDGEKEEADGTDVLDDVGRKEEKFDWFAQWYPLAPVCDLDKRVPHAKTVMGIDVVVWWDKAEGKWQVFGDSCPHRLAPLSEGRIDQWGRLQCVYHGWCFDGKGGCKLIPQAPRDGPEIHTSKKACATVYPSLEQNKIVWFWPNSDPQYKDISTKKKPPYIPELDGPSYTLTTGMRDINYGYEILMENLMDPSHVPYAHLGIMRITKNPNSIDREGGKPIEISIQSMDNTGFFGKKDNIGYGKFIAPCIFAVYPFQHVSTTDSSNGSIKESSLQKKQSIVLLFMCIPVSPGKSRLIWVSPRNFRVWNERILPRWIFHVRQNLILDSDLYLLHLEERKIAEVGPSNWQKSCFVPTKADGYVVGFRKWLKKYSNGQVCWGDTSSTALPPIPPREQLMDRYRTHVEQCSSCRTALKGMKALKDCLEVTAVASIGVVAAVKQNVLSTLTRSAMVSAAVVCFIASRWLSHFIYKNFYYHDYNHALK